MKFKNLGIIAILLSLLMWNCKENSTSPGEPMFNVVQANKYVIEIITNSLTKGTSEVFAKIILDSNSQIGFIRIFIEKLRYLEDSSGYFYCYDTNHICVAHPIRKDFIGTNRYQDKDSQGKPFAKLLFDSVVNFGKCWISFYWYNPTTQKDEEKLSFNKIIDNFQFILGTGFYIDTWKNWDITETNMKKRILEFSVHSLANGFSSVINTEIPNDKKVELIRTFLDSIRFFSDNSGYFFVDDLNGMSISLPIKKEMEGTNLYDYQDSKGKYTVREMIDIIKSKGKGFTDYYFTNPVTLIEQKKIVYIEKIIGTDYFIGAGFYTK